MRVVIDANVFLSYLLHPQRPTAASQVITQAIARDFDVVFPTGVADEVRSKAREKPYFRERIDPDLVDDLLSLIAQVALAPGGTTAPVASRDPKDQYLLDAATGDGVEFLITGDADLLDIVGTPGFALIVTPTQFLRLMDATPSQDR